MPSVSANPIIPTRFRSKIAHTHSYPLGAQEISRALAESPNFNRIELTFMNVYKQPPHAVSYEVLWLYCRRLYDFWDAERLLLENGEPDGLLNLTVRPVPRAYRHEIRTKLMAEALPAILLWTVEKQDMIRFVGSSLSFWFDEESHTLTCREAKHLEPVRD